MTESEITLALKNKDIQTVVRVLEELPVIEARIALRDFLNPHKDKSFWRYLDESISILEAIAANDALVAKLVETPLEALPCIPPMQKPVASDTIPEEMLLRQ
jgi:hypothetical protein